MKHTVCKQNNAILKQFNKLYIFVCYGIKKCFLFLPIIFKSQITMFKSIKFFTIIFALSVLVYSCMSDPIIPEERTAEMEQDEINTTLTTLEENGYDIDTTEMGVYYIVHVEGEGPTTMAGDTCFLQYAGYFLDGKVFDASDDHYEDGIWEFIFKEISIISGLEDGLALSSKGAEIDFIIPSEFAYGAQGNVGIPPYSTLLFSTIMHDLKPKE